MQSKMVSKNNKRFQPYQNCHCILEQDQSQGPLYLGDYPAANNKQLLKKLGIKTVLTIANSLPLHYSKESEIFHKIYPAMDIQGYKIKDLFPIIYDQINQGLERGGVLVHCRAGVSRSASTIISYIMKRFNWTALQSYQFVLHKRPVISPNPGFQQQLKEYETEIYIPSKEDDEKMEFNSPDVQKQGIEKLLIKQVNVPEQVQNQLRPHLKTNSNKQTNDNLTKSNKTS